MSFFYLLNPYTDILLLKVQMLFSGPRDSHENVIKLVGGGVGSGRSVKKWSLRFVKSKQRIACVPDHLKRKDFSFK